MLDGVLLCKAAEDRRMKIYELKVSLVSKDKCY
jgi:hypothetical protein